MSITASTEIMDSTKDLPKKKFINANLLSLKLLLFLFFGGKEWKRRNYIFFNHNTVIIQSALLSPLLLSGMGCLFPFLPLHMTEMGLSIEQIRMISIISPAVAILGPLIAAPIADKLADHQGRNDKSSTGRYLRVMIAIACILSAIFYAFLLIIPTVDRIETPRERRPGLKFSCDQTGAVVLQERCKDRISCHRWSDETKVGPLLLEGCDYACYPVGSKRWRSDDNDKFTPSGVTDSDFGMIDGSGETTVIPLESEMYARVNIEVNN